MTQAGPGDRVKVEYMLHFNGHTLYETRRGEDAVQFTLGRGEVIDGFEKTVMGMRPGEVRRALITPERAFGPYREDLLCEVERSRLETETEPVPGMRVGVQIAWDRIVPMRVARVADSTVTLDANHPLAGEDVRLEVRLLEVRSSQ